MTCRRCGGEAPTWIVPRDRTHSTAAAIVRCERCGACATDPPPPVGAAASTALADRGLRRRAADAVLRGELAPLTELIAPGARVLDVGAGSGNRAHVLRSDGYDVIALEPDPAEALRARTQLGDARVLGVPIEEIPTNIVGFDAVLLSHVLEHLAQPEPALDRLGRCLRPGGVLVVMVPNAESLEARIFRGRWHGWEPARHHWHFTEATLIEVLRRAGFDAPSVRAIGGWRYPASLTYSLFPQLDPQVSRTSPVLAAAAAALLVPLARIIAVAGGPQLVAVARRPLREIDR